jgi:hypothetical protein
MTSAKEGLKSFLECVEELKARPFILQGLHDFQFRIDCGKETGEISCEIHEADQETLRSFLMTFRKFLLKNDSANIDRTLDTCLEFARSEQTELKEALEQLKTSWNHQYKKGIIQMTSKNIKLTPEYVLGLWLNGTYFHSDPKKAAQLRQLLSRDVPSVKLQLLWSLDTIIRIGGLVNKALSEGALDFPEDPREVHVA